MVSQRYKTILNNYKILSKNLMIAYSFDEEQETK